MEPPVTPSDGSALAQPAVLSAQIDATNGSSGPATKAVRDTGPVGRVGYLSACGRSNAMEAPGSHNEQMEDAAAWLDRPPNELGPQRQLLQRLLGWCERDEEVRWLTVGCSLERGNGDRLLDLDVAMGVKEEHFVEALGRVRRAGRPGGVVRLPDAAQLPPAPFFAQYRDRTEVDLTVGLATAVNLLPVVVLYDPERCMRSVIVGLRILVTTVARSWGRGETATFSEGLEVRGVAEAIDRGPGSWALVIFTLVP